MTIVASIAIASCPPPTRCGPSRPCPRCATTSASRTSRRRSIPPGASTGTWRAPSRSSRPGAAVTRRNLLQPVGVRVEVLNRVERDANDVPRGGDIVALARPDQPGNRSRQVTPEGVPHVVTRKEVVEVDLRQLLLGRQIDLEPIEAEQDRLQAQLGAEQDRSALPVRDECVCAPRRGRERNDQNDRPRPARWGPGGRHGGRPIPRRHSTPAAPTCARGPPRCD